MLIAGARTASAQVASHDATLEAVAVRVDGFPGCPSSEEFWRRLSRRAPGIRLTRPGEPGRVFVVRFQATENGHTTGRLRVLDIEGSALEREVSGATCVEVADALALVAAVAARSDATIDTPSDAEPAPERSPRSPRPPATETAVAPVSEERAPAWSLLVRGQTSLRTQVLPASLYGAGAGFEFARDGSSSWQPAIGAMLEATLTGTASTDHIAPNTEMAAQLTMVRVVASPLRLRAGVVDLRPYVSLDVGRLALEGRGSGLTRDAQNRMFWIAAALLAQADVRLGAGWIVGASVGAEVHPFLYQFKYTDRDVYQVGDIGLIAGLSVAYRFE